MNDRLHTAGIGLHVGFDRRTGERRNGCTLAQLEADLAWVRGMGAPDDAKVIAVARGSVYRAEVIWVGGVR